MSRTTHDRPANLDRPSDHDRTTAPAHDAAHDAAKDAQDAQDAHGEARLADALRALNADEPTDQAVARAAEGAWARLGAALDADTAPASPGGRLQTDADFRSRIPAYLAGTLSAEERMLFDDRLRDSAALQVAVADARGRGRAHAPAERASIKRMPVPRWAMAAAAAVVVAVSGFVARDTLLPNRVMAHVADVDGALYHVDGRDGMTPLAADAAVHPRQRVRTARDGGAVLELADGSRVEMDARSEIALVSAWNGTTVRLLRGNVIVQAAEQKGGRLYVATEDARAAVKGTIFSVRSGTSGSRVSVIEGAVDVTHGGERTLLRPGQQVSTRDGLTPVPVGDDFAWSRDREQYMAIMAELRDLGEEIAASVPRPEPRTASKLLGSIPNDTVFFVSLPNLTETMDASYRLFRERVAESETLAAWWAEAMQDPEHEAELTQALDTLTSLGAPLGEELVVAMGLGADGEPDAPVLLAEVADEAALRAAIAESRAAPEEKAGEPLPITLVDDRAALDAAVEAEAVRRFGLPCSAPDCGADDGPHEVTADGVAVPPTDAMAPRPADLSLGQPTSFDPSVRFDVAMDGHDPELMAWVADGLLVVSPSAGALANALDGAAPAEGDDFRAGIAAAYGDGVDWLAAIDVALLVEAARVEAAEEGEEGAGLLLSSGLLGARMVTITQVERDGRTQFDAQVTFDGARRGIAGWLGAPAAMGALDYISPDASAASAFIIDDPKAAAAELLGWLDKAAPDLAEDPEAGLGTELLAALAAPLGGEMALALDGPVLPEPSLKLVAEVYDEAAMQAAIEEAVARIGALSTDHEGPTLEVTTGTLSGHATWSLRLDGDPGDPTAVWLYDGGYLIMATSPARLEDALRLREAGVNLASSAAFQEALPAGGQTAFSVLSWQNLAPWLNDLQARAGDRVPEELGGVSTAEIMQGLAPSLVGGWAEDDRIHFAAASESSPLGIEALLTMGMLPNVLGSMGSEDDGGGFERPGGAEMHRGDDPAWEYATGDLMRELHDLSGGGAQDGGR